MNKKLAFSSIITALGTLFLYLCSISPTGQIALFTLATAFLCIGVIECGAKYTIICAVATALLSFILIPNKLILLPYVVLFGYYPVLKLYLERIHSIVLEWVLKLCVAALAATILAVIANALGIVFPTSLPIIVLLAIVIFAIYDVALSLFISFYRQRISKHIK